VGVCANSGAVSSVEDWEGINGGICLVLLDGGAVGEEVRADLGSSKIKMKDSSTGAAMAVEASCGNSSLGIFHSGWVRPRFHILRWRILGTGALESPGLLRIRFKMVQKPSPGFSSEYEKLMRIS
jgi:hypothetical protein